MKIYLDEQLAFDALQTAAKNAVDRPLTEKEVRYIKWLARMDCETIETFVNLLTDAAR